MPRTSVAVVCRAPRAWFSSRFFFRGSDRLSCPLTLTLLFFGNLSRARALPVCRSQFFFGEQFIRQCKGYLGRIGFAMYNISYTRKILKSLVFRLEHRSTPTFPPSAPAKPAQTATDGHVLENHSSEPHKQNAHGKQTRSTAIIYIIKPCNSALGEESSSSGKAWCHFV